MLDKAIEVVKEYARSESGAYPPQVLEDVYRKLVELNDEDK